MLQEKLESTVLQMPKGATMIISYYENGESKHREATPDEIAYIETTQAEALATKQAQDEADAAKATAKLDLLNRLGITADEAALLLS
jgi:hypothetical protein